MLLSYSLIVFDFQSSAGLPVTSGGRSEKRSLLEGGFVTFELPPMKCLRQVSVLWACARPCGFSEPEQGSVLMLRLTCFSGTEDGLCKVWEKCLSPRRCRVLLYL